MSKEKMKLVLDALKSAIEALEEQPAPVQLPQGWSVVQVTGDQTKVWPMTEEQILALAEQPVHQEPLKNNEIKFNWQQAPRKHEWGAGVVEAVGEIDKDHTFHLYCDEVQEPKVEAMFKRCKAEQPPQLLTPNWLWAWLMDWCKRNGSSPAQYDSLFEMVADARNIAVQCPEPRKPLTDEQCDAITEALDSWAIGFGKYEYGLPLYSDVEAQAREIIRAAIRIEE